MQRGSPIRRPMRCRGAHQGATTREPPSAWSPAFIDRPSPFNATASTAPFQLRHWHRRDPTRESLSCPRNVQVATAHFGLVVPTLWPRAMEKLSWLDSTGFETVALQVPKRRLVRRGRVRRAATSKVRWLGRPRHFSTSSCHCTGRATVIKSTVTKLAQ